MTSASACQGASREPIGYHSRTSTKRVGELRIITNLRILARSLGANQTAIGKSMMIHWHIDCGAKKLSHLVNQ